jgi:outer membrane immunogenic protein
MGGRVGYLFTPAILSYFNAGFTQAHFSGSNVFEIGLPANPTTHTFGSPTFDGFFVGGGVETVLFPGWIVKTEYRFADYGTKHLLVDFGRDNIDNLKIRTAVQTVRTELT